MGNFRDDFKKFINRGNVVDMAVGVIIGGAFGKIVSSLVADVVMPVIGKLIGGIDFENIKFVLGEGENAPVLNLGIFIQNIVNFLIIALVVFIMVREMNKISGKFKKPEPKAEPTTKKCSFCKTEIAIDATRCPNCTSELE